MPRYFIQDGRDFYEADAAGDVIDGGLTLTYLDMVKNDGDLAGAERARARFIAEHPGFEAADPFAGFRS